MYGKVKASKMNGKRRKNAMGKKKKVMKKRIKY